MAIERTYENKCEYLRKTIISTCGFETFNHPRIDGLQIYNYYKITQKTTFNSEPPMTQN